MEGVLFACRRQSFLWLASVFSARPELVHTTVLSYRKWFSTTNCYVHSDADPPQMPREPRNYLTFGCLDGMTWLGQKSIQAAESGDLSAQLQLAEHFSQPVPLDGRHQDPVSAYMWYLLVAKTAAPLLEQLEEGKKNLAQSMSVEQIAEGETRAAQWLKNSKKKPGFAETGKVPTKALVANP